MLGAAEDLAGLLRHESAAAQTEPGLQAVDGLPTPAVVAVTRRRKEAVRVSGPAAPLLANGSEVLRYGQSGWEGDVREDCFGFYGNAKAQVGERSGRLKCVSEMFTSQLCSKAGQQCCDPEGREFSCRSHDCGGSSG